MNVPYVKLGEEIEAGVFLVEEVAIVAASPEEEAHVEATNGAGNWAPVADRKHHAPGSWYHAELESLSRPRPFPDWPLDETTMEWKPPVDPPAAVPELVRQWNEDTQTWKDLRMIISKNEFDDRFSLDEFTAIDESTDPRVRRARAKLFFLTERVDLEDQRLIDYLNYLEFVAKREDGVTPVIGSGRSAEIRSPTFVPPPT